MNQASPQFTRDEPHFVSRSHDERLPKVVIHFEVQPGATLSWRVDAHAELSVQPSIQSGVQTGTQRGMRGDHVWLTRVASPYDHWLQPGQPLQLRRGERVWVSTDANVAARLSLTTYPSARRSIVGRWLERLSLLNPDIYAPHSR
ncbi:MAG TPA: DUF2917 domain-containing protein [Paraburkholderia sp.]